MPVFKAFLKILNKSKLYILIYIGIYLALTFVMSGNAADSGASDYTQVSLEIGVSNQDAGELGDALTEYLSLENEIKDIPSEREDLLDAMYYRQIEYVLIIPEDFTQRFLAGERDHLLEGTVVPGNSTAYLAGMEIEEFLNTLAIYVDGGFSADEAAAQTLSDMQETANVEFLTQSDTTEAPAAYYYFRYLAYIFICVLTVSLSAVLIAFSNKDLDARNKCASLSFLGRNLQMILGSITVMLLEYAFFMLLAFIMYPKYMTSFRGLLYAANSFIYMLVCAAIAFLVGKLVRNGEELTMISNVIGISFSFLGGVFVSLDLMNENVKKFSKFIPSYWYTISNDAIWKMGSLADAGEISQNLLMTGAFAVAIFAIALMVSRLRAKTS